MVIYNFVFIQVLISTFVYVLDYLVLFKMVIIVDAAMAVVMSNSLFGDDRN